MSHRHICLDLDPLNSGYVKDSTAERENCNRTLRLVSAARKFLSALAPLTVPAP
jgi:hypothetical protein